MLWNYEIYIKAEKRWNTGLLLSTTFYVQVVVTSGYSLLKVSKNKKEQTKKKKKTDKSISFAFQKVFITFCLREWE